jgi:hypothetical protein
MIASLLADDARITIPNARVLTTRRPPISGALSRVLLAALKELDVARCRSTSYLAGRIRPDVSLCVAWHLHPVAP